MHDSSSEGFGRPPISDTACSFPDMAAHMSIFLTVSKSLECSSLLWKGTTMIWMPVCRPHPCNRHCVLRLLFQHLQLMNPLATNDRRGPTQGPLVDSPIGMTKRRAHLALSTTRVRYTLASVQISYTVWLSIQEGLGVKVSPRSRTY